MEKDASVLMELARHAFSTLMSCSPKLLTNTAAGYLLERFEKPLVDCFPFLAKLLPIRVVQVERAYAVLQEAVRRIEQTQDAERQIGFVNMCYRYFEVGAKEHREFKLKLLAAACAHCADVHNTDSFDIELEVFDAVERLQPFHISILNSLDEKHTVRRPDGGHEHPATATFEELLALPIEHVPPQDLWLTKALLTLRDMMAVYIQGGSGIARRPDGRMTPIVEPEQILRSGRIGLGEFGCKLLRYVKSAFEGEES